MYKMTKKRFDELGLGYDFESCRCCEHSIKKNGELFCSFNSTVPIKQLMETNYISDCLDDERLRLEMTDEEYDAYRHNRIEIIPE